MTVMKELQELIKISRYYGANKEYVVAGGGNTSYKNSDKIWVKASGHALATITEEGFVVLDRHKLAALSGKTYSEDPVERERQVKTDMEEAQITRDKRPSVETSLHDLISYRYVVHLHPNAVNGVMCGNDVEKFIEPLFGSDALYIPYTDPGYILFKVIEARLLVVRKSAGADPKVIVLQNHGIFVGADTTDEIKTIFEMIMGNIHGVVKTALPLETRAVDPVVTEIVPAIRAMVSSEKLKVLKVKDGGLISHFISDTTIFAKINKPFIPDIVVYCTSDYIYLDRVDKPAATVEQFREKYTSYLDENGHQPKVVLIKGLGMIAIGDNAAQADIITDVFESQLAISWYSESFGGQHFLSDESIARIDSWEVENYRRTVLLSETTGRVKTG
jgi:rhamnose utilization protein RhaD (predicted bifunctional aldolase and dehydrogenase)